MFPHDIRHREDIHHLDVLASLISSAADSRVDGDASEFHDSEDSTTGCEWHPGCVAWIPACAGMTAAFADVTSSWV
jgi:hypothetical protein